MYYSWLSKGCNYFVSLLFKGMYGYEYLLKEVAVALNTKVLLLILLILLICQ